MNWEKTGPLKDLVCCDWLLWDFTDSQRLQLFKSNTSVGEGLVQVHIKLLPVHCYKFFVFVFMSSLVSYKMSAMEAAYIIYITSCMSK